MIHERIRIAAEWLRDYNARQPLSEPVPPALDAAHILNLLAEGKAVLCGAEPVGWGMRKLDKLLVEDLVGAEEDVDYWLTDYKDAEKVSLHAPLDPWEAT